MNHTRSDRVVVTLAVIAALVLVPLLGYAAYVSFIKDWPSVTTTGEATIVGSAVVKPGGDLTWTREKVCIPEGHTLVRRTAVREPTVVNGVELTNGYDIGWFTIDIAEPLCVSPSKTIVVIPPDLYPGRYRIRLDTFTDNASLWPAKAEAYSPWFTVKR